MRISNITGWKRKFLFGLCLLLVTCVASVEAQTLGDDPTLADLIYNPQTGGVTLDGNDAVGGRITNFVLQSDAEFINTDGVVNPYGGAFFTSNPSEVSASDGNGVGLELIDLGSILNTDLDADDLEILFTRATYVGQLGSGEFNFEFVVSSTAIPEPSSGAALLGLSVAWIARRKRSC